MMNCLICNKVMDTGDVRDVNCGGDCRACMADSGDPDCIKSLAAALIPPYVFMWEEMKRENNNPSDT